MQYVVNTETEELQLGLDVLSGLLRLLCAFGRLLLHKRTKDIRLDLNLVQLARGECLFVQDRCETAANDHQSISRHSDMFGQM